MKDILNAYFLPGIAESEINYEEIEYGDKEKVNLRFPKMNPDTLKKTIENIKIAREYLTKKTVEELVEVIDQVNSKWRDKNYDLRKEVLNSLPAITNFSPQMAEDSVNAILEYLSKENLFKMLEAELEDPKYIDDFRPKKGFNGFVKAYGPKLITNIFSGNVPALPAISLTRGLLVKSSQLGKVASEEPLFANLFAQSIKDVDKNIANTMALTYWKGGDEAIETVAFNEADVVVVYGGVEATEGIRKRIPPGRKFIPYGHKLSFGVVGREYLNEESSAREVASKAALDTSLYDQLGCLSPHLWYIERGGNVTPERFTELLAEEMEKTNEKLPRGKISKESKIEIQKLRGIYDWMDDAKVIYSEKSTDWTVIYTEKKKFEPSCLNRVIRVKPIDDIQEVRELVTPLSQYLQTIGTALYDDRLLRFSDEMGKIGVTRITPIGRMGYPANALPHDGSYGLRDLIVRWVAIEK
jgi:hypothetical protein